MEAIAVIGAGSWGTALAVTLARKGLDTRLWGRDGAKIAAMQAARENTRYLPGYCFPDTLHVTANLAEALQGTTCVLMVTPSHGFRAVFREALPLIHEGAPVVTATKGIEIASGLSMTQLMAEEAKTAGRKLPLCALSGPSFAEEVAAGHPTAVTVAAEDLAIAAQVQALFADTLLRVYTSTDIRGLEISGAMKNVIAIASGISDGLGYGLNTRAALITRGLAEITRLGLKLGADPRTFAGLSGMGDLVLTATGNLSRNRQVGLALGRGEKLADILAKMSQVAEGVRSTKSCRMLANRAGVEMPILEQTYAVLYEDRRPEDAVSTLFQRDLKAEQFSPAF